jgi:hypothetical protein
MADTRKYAEKLLDQLIVLDKQTTAAYYEMGRILYSIKQGKLYDVLGYESHNRHSSWLLEDVQRLCSAELSQG